MNNPVGVTALFALTLSTAAHTGPIYHPPGANLTFGDVTHGMRVQSASSNPAAIAADQARYPDSSIRGTAISAAAGTEYLACRIGRAVARRNACSDSETPD